jgi:hypothetical protein
MQECAQDFAWQWPQKFTDLISPPFTNFRFYTRPLNKIVLKNSLISPGTDVMILKIFFAKNFCVFGSKILLVFEKNIATLVFIFFRRKLTKKPQKTGIISLTPSC